MGRDARQSSWSAARAGSRRHMTMLVNGAASADPARALALDDRGFQYGDGLFETMLLADGRVRALDAHLRRLEAGCARLAIAAPAREVLLADIAGVTGSARSGVIKIIVSRGVGPRGYRPTDGLAPTRVIALHPPPAPARSSTIAIRWCSTRLGRNALLAGIKHLNRLEQVLAQAEWRDEQVEEGLMLDTEGELVCATAGNVFIVRDGTLVTPDLRFSGVRGVMREQVLDAAKRLGIPVSEEPLWPHDVEIASEVFITNAIRGIRPVAVLDSLNWHATPVAAELRKVIEQ
jgi:4-amino-4-deoxychorismate lyase